MDEAQLIVKRLAYLDQVQALHRRDRLIGFAMILAGMVLVVPSRWVPAWPQSVIWFGYGLVAVGWLLFIYVIWRRTAWRRANPFNPDA